MIAGCRGGDEERENRNGKEGEEREREGAGGDARIVRRSNTCGEMRERKRREWGEIGSEDGREMDERIRKRRERIENERSEGEQ
ncbi:hypothetical protein MTP99_003143 [Tenebrio molitor]|jgi:hypothetical protein|nr:hypothetical protein MTP99_003143 [Tenebrio molitor]